MDPITERSRQVTRRTLLRSGANGLGAMALFACVFSVPQAMMTAELSTAMPDNGGYSLWVQAAFGDFWGVQESYWSWFSGVVDSALYPVLLYSSAMQLLSGAGAGAAHEGTCAAANATLPASLLAHGGALATDAMCKAIGANHQKSAAQVALKWLLAHNATIATQSTSAAHLSEDVQLFDFSLTADEMQRLSKVQ